MGDCKLTNSDKNEAIQDFDNILARIGAEYVDEIPIVPVSKIGLPNLTALMQNAWDSSGKKVMTSRLTGVIVSCLLFFLSPEYYIFSAISLIIAFLIFLWFDLVVLSVQSHKEESQAKWFMLSLLATFAMAFGIGIPTKVFLSAAMMIEPLGFWEMLFIGGCTVFMLTFAGAFGFYRVYIQISQPDYVSFEERFVAVRKCLRAPKGDTSYEPPENPTETALKSETNMALLKYVILLFLATVISFIGPFVYLITMDFLMVILELVGIAFIGILIKIGTKLLRKGRILAHSIVDVANIGIFIVSLPLAFAHNSTILVLLIYAVGLVYLAIAWMSVQKKAKENPEILGQPYYTQYLASLSREDALQFVERTRDQLDALMH